ncbi:hypothetical protein [Microbacterium aurantiacum]|uniref:hypothetical protein n=1 Tax=Microbacterium aurantiacum TaxID=162393 RepID=UPI00341CD901
MTRRRSQMPKHASLATALALTLAGCATPSPSTLPPTDHGEVLHAAPVTVETLDWMTEVQAILHDDPRLGAVAIDESRSTVTVTWFGEQDSTVEELIARAPGGLEVVVQPADFLPGDLQDMVVDAMQPDAVPGVEMTLGHARNDGSGLEFGIVELPGGLTESDVAALIAESLERPDIPITVTVTGAVRAAGA